MMVICNANAIIEYDRRRPGIPSAALDMEHDNSITEESIAIALNIQHNPYLHIHVHLFSVLLTQI